MPQQLLIRAVAIALLTFLTLGSNPAAAAEKVKFRIAFTTAKGALGDQQVRIFADLVEKTIPGFFEIEIFPGSQLGTGTENVQAVETGSLEASALGSEGIGVDPKLGIFELPWVFPNFKSFQEAVAGPLFDQIARVFNQHRMQLVAIYGSGFRDILTRRPAESLAGFKGLRVRIAPSPVRVKFFQKLEAIPITIEWADTYLALQQGTVGGVEAFPVFLRSGKMYEQAKYLNDIKYVSAPFFMVFSQSFWQKLPKTAQDALLRAGRESMARANALAESEEQRDIQFMTQQGVTVVRTDLRGFEKIRGELILDYQKKFGNEWLRVVGITK